MDDKLAFNSKLFRQHMMQQRIIEMRLTVRQASEQIGISSSTISRIENDKSITIESFCKCLKWLNTSSCNYFWDRPSAREMGFKEPTSQRQEG